MQKTATAEKRQLHEIYIVRALAILAVMIVHAASIPLGELDPQSLSFAGYNAVNIWFRFGTTTFIFLSALVLFYSYWDRPLTGKRIARFYRRRLLYIIIPYVIGSTYYYFIKIFYSYGETWEQFLQHASWSEFGYMLLTGKAFYHLYFIFISIQLYLLFPVMLWLLQRFPKAARHLIGVGLVLQWAFIFYNEYYWNYPDKGSLALSYLSYYFLGAYCGIFYDRIKNRLEVAANKLRSGKPLLWALIWLGWLAAGCGHVYIWHKLRANADPAPALMYEFLFHAYTFLTTLVLLQAAWLLYRKLRPTVTNVLIHLGAVSFGAYLIHAGLLFFYTRYMPHWSDPLLYHLRTVGGFAFTLALSWLIVGIAFAATRHSWVLFGSLPKKSAYVDLPAKHRRQPDGTVTASG